MIKPIKIKANFYRIIFFLILLLSSKFSFSQGDPLSDPWSDESSIFEESNLYIDAYSSTNKRPIFEDQPALGGGYLGIGVLKAPTTPDPRRMNTPCVPGYCDYGAGCVLCVAPINSEIVYLIIAGLIYGIYKSRKKFIPLNIVN